MSPGVARKLSNVCNSRSSIVFLDIAKNTVTFTTLLLAASHWDSPAALGQALGSVYIDVFDKETEEPVPFRAQVRTAKDRVVVPRGVQVVDGWSLVDGSMHYRGPAGDYSYRVFHGPEYTSASGQFTLDKNASNSDTLHLERHADLSEEFWYGGDLSSRVPRGKTLPWLPAEGLHMAACLSPAIADEQATEPDGEATSALWVEQSSYEDTRIGSGLVIHHWHPPAQVPNSLPSARLLVLAKSQGKLETNEAKPLEPHCEITRLWARDLPIWLASERIDSVQLLGEHLTYDGTRALAVKPLVPIAGGYSQEGRVAGRMVEQLYWKILDTGLRIPPTAGSGFGEHGSPLGYNRVYAYCEHSLSPEAWWQAVRDGKTFVSNGPLLRATVNGQVPGHLFESRSGKPVELEVGVQLTVSDPVEYLDVIFNGKSLYQARLDEFSKQGGKIPKLQVDESGWLVVRVVTERDHTYRLATTAPYYVELSGRPRVSRSAVEFFQEWCKRARAELQAAAGAEWEAAKPFLDAADRFWEERLALANAD